MKKALLCLLLICPLFSMGQSINNQIIHLYDSLYKLSLGDVTYFVDSSSVNTTINDLLKNKEMFQTERSTVNHSSEYYWIKFDLTSREKLQEEWIMSFQQQNYLEVYIDSIGCKGSFCNPAPKKAGSLVPAYEKDYLGTLTNSAAVKVSLEPGKKYIIYIRLKNLGNIRIFKKTGYKQLYSDYQIERNLTQGMFQGIMLLMTLYNFLIFVMNREKIYLYYTGYIFIISLVLMASLGFMVPEWLGDYPIVNTLILGSSNLAAFFYAWFGLLFNDTRSSSPRWYHFMRISFNSVLCFALTAIIIYSINSFFLFEHYVWSIIYNLVYFLDDLIALITSLLLIAYTASLFFVESRFKVYFIPGSMLLYGTFAFILLNHLLGLDIKLMSGFSNLYLLEIAIVGEILCFSLGLGYRMKINEEEKREAQTEVLQKTMENESLLQEQNLVLEERIQERTEELQVMNEELNSTVEELSLTLEVLDNQKNTIETINRKMTSSISYALTIQTAILPSEEYLKKHLKEYALVYRPRDIVSGDFYWIHALGDSLIVAVADCTGHGVAGAFTSLIGIDILNDLLKEHGKNASQLKPSQIITYLDLEINSRLKQHERQSFKEGMDIGICQIKKEAEESFSAVFAGAKRPLYYKRRSDVSLQRIQGDRKSVGTGLSGSNVFTDHQMEFQGGDILYLSTDGFEDQNSPERKKFGEGRLLELLDSISSKDMGEQKGILEQALDAHQREADQRDDIALLGFRL